MTLANFNALMSMTVAIPLSIGLPSLRKIQRPEQILLVLFSITLLVEVTAYLLIRNGLSSLFLFGPFIIIETLLVSMFYNDLVRIRQSVVIVAFGVICAIVIWEMIARPGVFSSISISISRLWFICLSTTLLYQYSTGRPYPIGILIINSTMLFYCLSNLIYFAVAADIKDRETLLFMIKMHSTVNASCNIAFAIGLWKLKR